MTGPDHPADRSAGHTSRTGPRTTTDHTPEIPESTGMQPVRTFPRTGTDRYRRGPVRRFPPRSGDRGTDTNPSTLEMTRPSDTPPRRRSTPTTELARLREAHRRQHRDAPCDTDEVYPRCRWCHPDLPGPGAHFTPATDAEWAGRARMAAARAAAGQPLDDLDRQALDLATEEHP